MKTLVNIPDDLEARRIKEARIELAIRDRIRGIDDREDSWAHVIVYDTDRSAGIQIDIYADAPNRLRSLSLRRKVEDAFRLRGPWARRFNDRQGQFWWVTSRHTGRLRIEVNVIATSEGCKIRRVTREVTQWEADCNEEAAV